MLKGKKFDAFTLAFERTFKAFEQTLQRAEQNFL